MKKITKETVLAERNKKPRRELFAVGYGLQKSKIGKPTFDVEIESAKKVFEYKTGLKLTENQMYKNYWRYVTPKQIEKVEEWEKKQGSRVYLRNCLSLSLALDLNLTDNTSGEHTEIGTLEYEAKSNKNQDSINKLVGIVSQEIQDLPYYKGADLICSVPPHRDKDFDLPSRVTSLVSTKIGKQDVTGGFVFDGQKSSVKTATLDEKWNIWEGAQVSFQNSHAFDVKDKTVVLIDDKYQSGITIQYIAMKLQQAGAREVYGLCFVKTLRDTDNSVRDE